MSGVRSASHPPRCEGTRLDPSPETDAKRVVVRLVASVALVLITIVVPPLLAIAGGSLLEITGDDETFRLWQLLFFTMWAGGMFLLWMRYIPKGTGRERMTAWATLLLFLIALPSEPLWYGARSYPEMGKMAETPLAAAVWLWVAVRIWWKRRRYEMQDKPASATRSATSVPVVVRCLVASTAMPFFLLGLFAIVGVLLDHWLRIPLAPSLAVSLSMLGGFIAWVLIWRPAVRWSSGLIKRTMLEGFAYAGVVFAVVMIGLMKRSLLNELVAVMLLMVLPLAVFITWMIRTVIIWSPQLCVFGVDVNGPHCRKCGYSLVGLRHTRCPECGDEPTLDALWAAHGLG